MGNQGHTDGQRPYLQRLATCHVTGRLQGFAHPALSTATHVHRQIVAPRQQTHAMHVIGMFVGYQNRAQLVRANAQPGQAALGFS